MAPTMRVLASLVLLASALPAAQAAVVSPQRDAPAADARQPTGKPHVVGVCAVARDILAIEIAAQVVEHATMAPYSPAPGDEVAEVGDAFWAWDLKSQSFAQIKEKTVTRLVDGQRRPLGMLSPDGASVLASDHLLGEALDVGAADAAASYTISSTDDKAYAQPLAPTAVYRKSKPTDSPTDGHQPLDHHVYLRLPSPLVEGASYTISIAALKADAPSATYRHDTTKERSEAVHAIHTGYRADDPSKCATLSIWLGTGGGYQNEGIDAFEVVDESGKAAFTGHAALSKAKDAPEKLWAAKDYARTAVWKLDFGAFAKPGKYRVRVPGIGCSDTFEIADDVWRRAYLTAMRGFVNQRSGIALEAPWADIVRHRTFHPDDGVKFFQMDIPVSKGQEGPRGDDLVALQKAGKLTEVGGVWGGYQDAGDWDSMSGHLSSTELLLELAEMFPKFAADTKLSLPPAEAADKIPDVLNEALWNLMLYRRLQQADGGVRGGYGEGWGGRGAMTSDMSKAVGVYIADPESSLIYAGCAAKASGLLAKLDATLAKDLGDSAARAWTWAKTNGGEQASARWRAFAAVELYALAGDAAYRDAFLAVTELKNPGAYVEQPEASFTYARLPDAKCDQALRAKAVTMFAAAADRAIAFANGNGFGVTTDRTDLPIISWVGYFSTPGMSSQNLPRAHFLTKDPRHLGAVVSSCAYMLGANPENRTYTIGVGHAWPHHPLHLDGRRTGHEPIGVTVYGCGDESGDMSRRGNDWVHKWFTWGMAPDWYDWPAQEQDLDIYAIPALDEFTISQQIGPVSYSWGYLAARP
jgi:endoglucanase